MTGTELGVGSLSLRTDLVAGDRGVYPRGMIWVREIIWSIPVN